MDSTDKPPFWPHLRARPHRTGVARQSPVRFPGWTRACDGPPHISRPADDCCAHRRMGCARVLLVVALTEAAYGEHSALRPPSQPTSATSLPAGREITGLATRRVLLPLSPAPVARTSHQHLSLLGAGPAAAFLSGPAPLLRAPEPALATRRAAPRALGAVRLQAQINPNDDGGYSSAGRRLGRLGARRATARGVGVGCRESCGSTLCAADHGGCGGAGARAPGRARGPAEV